MTDNNCCNAGCPRCPWKPETSATPLLEIVMAGAARFDSRPRYRASIATQRELAAAEPLTVWCETCAATVYVGHECEGDDA